MPTTPNCAEQQDRGGRQLVVWDDAAARKFGWLSTLEVIASAKMNAAVAVRKSSPTKTAVLLLDVAALPSAAWSEHQYSAYVQWTLESPCCG